MRNMEKVILTYEQLKNMRVEMDVMYKRLSEIEVTIRTGEIVKTGYEPFDKEAPKDMEEIAYDLECALEQMYPSHSRLKHMLGDIESRVYNSVDMDAMAARVGMEWK